MNTLLRLVIFSRSHAPRTLKGINGNAVSVRCALFILAVLSGNICVAGELNQRTHLPPAVQAKVSALLANAYAQGNTAQPKTVVTNGKGLAGQQVEVGTSHNAKNAPREQNTVVNGDITVICQNCR